MQSAIEPSTGATANVTDTDEPKTLYAALQPQLRNVEDIKRDHPTIATVSTVLGAVPNAYQVGLLFRGAFTALSLLPDRFLDVPAALLGRGGNMQTTAVAGYAASERSSCTYCALHCCALMQRFDAPDSALSESSRTPAEAASAAHGASLAGLPNSVEAVTAAMRELRKHLPETDLGIQADFVAVLGFLNTFSGMLGVPAELLVALEVRPQLAAAGKEIKKDDVDGPMYGASADAMYRAGGMWGFALKLLRLVPAAVFYSIHATWGIPGDKNGARALLVDRLGASLSVLEDATSDAQRRTLVISLLDNLVAEECKFSRELKYVVGLAFARARRNDLLAGNMQTLLAIERQSRPPDPSFVNGKLTGDSAVPDGLADLLLSVWKRADGCGLEWCQVVLDLLPDPTVGRKREVAGLMLCLTAFGQPIRTGEEITANVLEELDGAETVEIVSWMSLLTMINRMMLSKAAAKFANRNT